MLGSFYRLFGSLARWQAFCMLIGTERSVTEHVEHYECQTVMTWRQPYHETSVGRYVWGDRTWTL